MHFSKAVVKYRIPILIITLILMIPSIIGMITTRVNYDMLTYLPEDMDTVIGQNELMEDFNKGGFTFLIFEDMQNKDVAEIKTKIEKIEHVDTVLWYDSLADLSIPMEILPDEIYNEFNTGHSTLMAVFFDSSTSEDETMDAVKEIRSVAGKQCFVSGMTALVVDLKDLCEQEEPIYVGLAVLLACIAMLALLDSWLIPFVFLASIGSMILLNLGTNFILGEISYITKALSAVLQLAVTMDYSIFLWHSYNEQKEKFEDQKDAMAVAIKETLASVVGSSITTIAGFIALCFMSFTLGRDLGIVMAKGVIIGVICCVTVLPAMILVFDGAIEKTKHKALIPSLDKASGFITKHYKVWLIVFLVLLYPAIYGNNHTQIYYNIDKSLPSTLASNVANDKLKEDFDMSTVHMVLLKKGLDSKQKTQMLDKIDKVDGVKWSLGMNSLIGPTFPESMIPSNIREMLESDNYEVQFVCSEYSSATDECNAQLDKIQEIVKSYSPESMVIGEAPLMKDLQDTTDVDLQRVNILSMAAIFVIILFVFKSISLPFILLAVIEFAIFVNMAIPYYQGVTLPFVASIVIGAIQLGATVDYAILMTSNYQKQRHLGKTKKESISIAHKFSMKSIIVSGCSFFAATFGVALYSKVDMIGSICTLLARGAVISTIVVLLILPAMFMVFDPIIVHTSKGFLPDKK